MIQSCYTCSLLRLLMDLSASAAKLGVSLSSSQSMLCPDEITLLVIKQLSVAEWVGVAALTLMLQDGGGSLPF